MKPRSHLALLATGLLLATAFAGCEQPPQKPGDRDPRMGPPPDRSRAPRRETSPPAPRRSGSAGRFSAPAGHAAVAMYLPSGDEAGSPISVLKHAPREVVVGQPFDWTIEVTNTTDVDLDEVTLREEFPPEFRPMAATPDGDVAGRTATWNLGTLAAGATERLTVRGTAADIGSLVSCSHVSYRIPRVCLAVEAVRPALELTKTGPADVLACDDIAYVLTVTNTGTGPATNVRVMDDLPDGLRTVDGEESAAFRIASLPAGASRKMEVVVRAAGPGRYVNKATAAGDPGLTADAEFTTTVRKPTLEVTKTGPEMRYVGRPVEYEITVRNTGDGEARRTTLTDTLSDHLTFVRASDGGTMSRGKVTWDLGTLDPGDARTVAVTAEARRMGTARNEATAEAYCARGSAAVTTEIEGIPAILLECVDIEDPVEVGTNTTYVITVTNQGSAVGTDIVIACTLPPEQAFVSADGPTEDTVDGKKVAFAPIDTLAPKDKATYRVVVRGTRPGDVRFEVMLTSDQMTKPARETEATRIYAD